MKILFESFVTTNTIIVEYANLDEYLSNKHGYTELGYSSEVVTDTESIVIARYSKTSIENEPHDNHSRS